MLEEDLLHSASLLEAALLQCWCAAGLVLSVLGAPSQPSDRQEDVTAL